MPLFAVKKKAEPPKRKPVETNAAACETLSEGSQDILASIQRRRLQMLVHSCIYYHLNENIWTDAEFDAAARDLVQLQKEHPELAKVGKWAEAFKDWDATTGYHLPLTDSWVMGKAIQLIRLNQEAKEK